MATYAVFERVSGRWVLHSRFSGDKQGLSAQERAEMCVEALRDIGREARVEATEAERGK